MERLELCVDTASRHGDVHLAEAVSHAAKGMRPLNRRRRGRARAGAHVKRMMGLVTTTRNMAKQPL